MQTRPAGQIGQIGQAGHPRQDHRARAGLADRSERSERREATFFLEFFSDFFGGKFRVRFARAEFSKIFRAAPALLAPGGLA